MIEKLYYVIGATVFGGVVIIVWALTVSVAINQIYWWIRNRKDLIKYHLGSAINNEVLRSAYLHTTPEFIAIRRLIFKYRLRNIRKHRRS